MESRAFTKTYWDQLESVIRKDDAEGIQRTIPNVHWEPVADKWSSYEADSTVVVLGTSTIDILLLLETKVRLYAEEEDGVANP
jgi:hypothetical protein